MNDRTLLEFAAKAAGLWDAANNCIDIPWNPLNDDGDALRLAVKLRLTVHVWEDGEDVSVAQSLPDGTDPPAESSAWHAACAHACGSQEGAARRAIVRAAAEIGKAMP